VSNGFTGNSAVVCQLYVDLLGRVPSSSEVAGWVGSGLSLYNVALDIDMSTEYRSDYIQGDYMAFLNRPADQGGLQTWLGKFSAGWTDEMVDAGILSSQEFFNDSGGTNTGYVTALYRDLLGRATDAGASTWINMLNSGTSRYTVALEIDTSPESRQDTVQYYYLVLLNRGADPTGLTNSVAFLNAGNTDEQLIAEIAISTEFYNDANR